LFFICTSWDQCHLKRSGLRALCFYRVFFLLYMGYLLQEVSCEGHRLIFPSLAYDNTTDIPTEEMSVVYFRPICTPTPTRSPRFRANFLLCGDVRMSRPSGARPQVARHSVTVDLCVILVRRNLAIGIAIQNFPEGLAVSLPLKAAGFSTVRSFL